MKGAGQRAMQTERNTAKGRRRNESAGTHCAAVRGLVIITIIIAISCCAAEPFSCFFRLPQWATFSKEQTCKVKGSAKNESGVTRGK